VNAYIRLLIIALLTTIAGAVSAADGNTYAKIQKDLIACLELGTRGGKTNDQLHDDCRYEYKDFDKECLARRFDDPSRRSACAFEGAFLMIKVRSVYEAEQKRR
jgi:hypothetical protein